MTERGWCEVVERVFAASRLSPVVVVRWSRVLTMEPELADASGIDRSHLGRLGWLGLGIWRLSDLLPRLHKERQRFADAAGAKLNALPLPPANLEGTPAVIEGFRLRGAARRLLDTLILIKADHRVERLARVLGESHYSRPELLALMSGLSRAEVQGLLEQPRLAAVVAAIDLNGVDAHGRVKRSRRQRVTQPRRLTGIQYQLEWAQ